MRLIATLAVLSPLLVLTAAESYRESVERYRREREARLLRDDGWLTVAGLFWLKEGENTVGSGAGNEIRLSGESAPERVGSFLFRKGKIVFFAERGAGVTANGAPVTSIEMRPDKEGPPTVIALGDLAMQVIQRGERLGIRLRDKNSKFRRAFRGLEWFPINEAWCVTARFVPHAAAKTIAVPNVLGDIERRPSPGYVVFTLDGKEYRLEPVTEENRLFFIFKDLTSGKETYPAGRFLYAEMPTDGKVELDFNKAYNPPCAFTPYATCPLPPKQNRLAVRISAGEKRYGH